VDDAWIIETCFRQRVTSPDLLRQVEEHARGVDHRGRPDTIQSGVPSGSSS
jgi:hypothetical protein